MVSLNEVVEQVLTVLLKQPEKDVLAIRQDLEAGKRPRYAPLTISRQPDPEDPAFPTPKDDLEKLTQQIAGCLKPLELDNPISPVLGLGGDYGTGFMSSGFGAKIMQGPPYHGGVVPLTPDELEKLKVPEPDQEERFEAIKKQIAFYVEHTPVQFKIGLPDIQGPFNIAHALVGTDIFMMMADAPEKVHALMAKTAEYYLRCFQWFRKNIPADRWIPLALNGKRISECSVNLISREKYREFVLPYDRKIVEAWRGVVAIHPCSGPHVIEVTLESFPDEIRSTECGIIPCASAGYMTVDDAVKKVKGRRIILDVGEELTEGKEEETVRHHIDLMKEHPLMMLSYTGMSWKRKDDEFIRSLHRRLDDYYYTTGK